MNDVAAMSRAIELSALGTPAINPFAVDALLTRKDGGGGGAHVGCVLVRDGEVVGEGFYDHSGCPHAEVVALGQAQDRARGATAYVTLEPCNHHGRTPPCSDALIAAGVVRVVAACLDPNPRATGGAEKLRVAGIAVEFGLLEAEARQANWQFLRAIEAGRPAVTIKTAMSLDGRIALPSGESKWITGPEAREEGQRLRAQSGAVLVGRGTVETDDPRLTVRSPEPFAQPLRIVLDPGRRLTGREQVFSQEAPTIRVVAKEAWDGELEVPLLDGTLDLEALLIRLGKAGINGVLVEGGGATIGHFLKAGLWDRMSLFVAPKILGAGPAWAGELGNKTMAEIGAHRIQSVERWGEDVCLKIERRSE